MSIKYFVFQTRFQNESKFFGRAILNGTYDRDAIVGRMLKMGTSMTKTDIVALLQLLSETIEMVCSEGFRVNIEGLVSMTPVVGGQFLDKKDFVTAGRNTLYLTSQVSKALNDRFAQAATPEKVIVDENRPILIDVVDAEAEEGVAALKAGNIMTVSGKRLKFDVTHPEEYLRLVNAENSTEFLPITKFQKMSSQELVFRLPPAAFRTGYFELASYLNTRSVRVGQSPDYELTAG